MSNILSKYLLLPKTITIELLLKHRDPTQPKAALPFFGEDDSECYEEIRELPFVDMIDEGLNRDVSITVMAPHPRDLNAVELLRMQQDILDIIAKHETRCRHLNETDLARRSAEFDAAADSSRAAHGAASRSEDHDTY